MEELLTGLVPGLPAALRGQILARAEGVPLYAVETVRMLLDRGALVQEGSVVPAGRRDRLARGSRDAARADRRAARRPRRRRTAAAPGRRRARQDVHARRRSPRSPGCRGGARAAPRLARPQGGAVAPVRPPLARARAVRVPAGPRPARRLRDALEARAQGPPSRRRRAPRARCSDEDEVARSSRRTSSRRTSSRPMPRTRRRSRSAPGGARRAGERAGRSGPPGGPALLRAGRRAHRRPRSSRRRC